MFQWTQTEKNEMIGRFFEKKIQIIWKEDKGCLKGFLPREI